MNYYDYINIIKGTPETQGLEYDKAVMWLHSEKLPLGVVSLNGCTDKIIKIPKTAVNSYGQEVDVIGIGCDAFQGNTNVTDVILPLVSEWLAAAHLKVVPPSKGYTFHGR